MFKFELPCDWSVNRRPNSSGGGVASNIESSSGNAKTKGESSSNGTSEGHVPCGKTTSKNKATACEAVVIDKVAKSNSSVDGGGGKQTSPALGDHKEESKPTSSTESKSSPDQGTKAKEEGETSGSAISGHILGPRSNLKLDESFFPLESNSDHATAESGQDIIKQPSKNGFPWSGQIKKLVIKHLQNASYKREEEDDDTASSHNNGDAKLRTQETYLDAESLLSKLPYKKMLSDMFGGNLRGNLQTSVIPYVTRAYEEAFMHEPVNSSERECARGKQCECMFIDRLQPFVCVEFLLPGEQAPPTPHLCVLCCRSVTQQLYYDVIFDKCEFPGTIQRFGNIHSEPGEYSLDAMLIASPTAPVHIMPLPIVSHQRNRYTVQWSVMPLFAHWRHTPVFSGVKRGCGGGAPKNQNGGPKDQSNEGKSASIFCHHDASIEKKLIQMHALQRGGDKNIQCEIDRYLIACISKAQAHLVLPRNSIAHYDNLPDISAYALGILDPTMDSEVGLQQVLLLLRQCIPLRRRTKRAQREVQWREESCFAMQTLVRCMQGTLLGLYPNSLKVIAFGARIGIWRLLRSILVLTFEKLHLCMQNIPYIIKLCCMEHLCNTIYDYHPGICHTLNQSGQKVEHFCNSVSTICDIFRGELNTMYCAAETVEGGKTRDSADVVVGILTPLEKIAHSYFERCTRAYRGIIIGNIQQIKSVDHAKRLMIPAVIPYIGFILENIRTACSQCVFDMVHAEKLPRHFIELAWYITQTIQVHVLPQCIAKKQLIALGNRYSGDTTCIAKCRIMYICVQCAIKRGSAHGMRLRHDCRTNALLCIHCGPGTVLTIDMLGRMLVVANEKIILSSCCGSFVYYSGSGFEYSTACGVQCSQGFQFHKKKEKPSHVLQQSSTTTQSTKSSKRKLDLSTNGRQVAGKNLKNSSEISKTDPNGKVCILCRQKNIQQSLPLLDIKRRAIVQHPLCSKHVIPHHICKTLWDLEGIHKYFRQRNSLGASCDDASVAPEIPAKAKFKKRKP